ncbi:MAG: hypothetical protein E6Q44_08855 [Flavobacteriales bacterium]|nr:MAG: hypothetical protein E6Q44_08855 [Flavobacteriales bacterium]
MSEYKVLVQGIMSIINRDLPKAAEGLESQVNPLIDAGWRVQGGLTTVQAGGNIYLLQAMTW